jgi:hypothetical protein
LSDDTCKARSKRGSATMTIGAHDVTSVDLVENRLPFVTTDTDGDTEALAPDVVELEHQWVLLSAINARSLAEELDEVGHALGDQGAFSTTGVRDVPLAVDRIVLPFVRSSTRAAVVVTLPLRLAMPGEVLQSL